MILRADVDVKKIKEQKIRDNAKNKLPYKKVKSNGYFLEKSTTKNKKKNLSCKERLKRAIMKIISFFIVAFLFFLSVIVLKNDKLYYHMQELASNIVTFNATISVGLAALLLTMFLQMRHRHDHMEIKEKIMSMLHNFIGIILFSLALLLLTHIAVIHLIAKIVFLIFLFVTILVTLYSLWSVERVVASLIENFFSNDEK